MKIAAIILAIFGAGHLMYLPKVFHLADDPRWLLDLLASIGGILLLLISVGIWTHKKPAWYLGFIFLGLLVAQMGIQQYNSSQRLGDKVPPFYIPLIFLSIVPAFFAIVWYRQKKWFNHDQVV